MSTCMSFTFDVGILHKVKLEGGGTSAPLTLLLHTLASTTLNTI